MTDHSAALLVATMDTKGREATYIADCIRKKGIPVLIMDAGIRGTCETLAKIIGESCNQARGAWKILVPMKGFSAFDHPQGPLHDPAAPHTFVTMLEKVLDNRDNLSTLPYHVNDPDFSRAILETLQEIIPEYCMKINDKLD